MYRGREYVLWPESRDLTLHENKIALTRHNRKVHTCRLGIVIRRRLKLPCILVESLDAGNNCRASNIIQKQISGRPFCGAWRSNKIDPGFQIPWPASFRREIEHSINLRVDNHAAEVVHYEVDILARQVVTSVISAFDKRLAFRVKKPHRCNHSASSMCFQQIERFLQKNQLSRPAYKIKSLI